MTKKKASKKTTTASKPAKKKAAQPPAWGENANTLTIGTLPPVPPSAYPDGAVTLEQLIPWSEADCPTWRLHIDINLQGRQAWSLRKLYHGLQEAEAKTADGKPVKNINDAIRWLLEWVATRAEPSRAE